MRAKSALGVGDGDPFAVAAWLVDLIDDRSPDLAFCRFVRLRRLTADAEHSADWAGVGIMFRPIRITVGVPWPGM